MVDTVASVDFVARTFNLFSTLSPVWTGLKTNKTYGRAGGRAGYSALSGSYQSQREVIVENVCNNYYYNVFQHFGTVKL